MEPIANALSAAGYHVWWDKLMEGGSAFADTIQQRLESCDAVVVAWSQAAVQSDWVRDEAATGRDRKRMVPLSLDGTEPPLGFRQYHSLDFSDWTGQPDYEAVQDLLRAIAGIVTGPGDGPDSVAVGQAVAPSAQSRIARRKVLIGGAGGLVAAAAAGIVAWKPWAARPVGNSVAVLPFVNLSDDPSQTYFSDGLSEEIRSELARNSELKVAAPTSTNKFRDGQDDAKTIARKLGVTYLLEGSVRKSGDIVRIVAELIDAKSGFAAWSQTFERKLGDIFAIQDTIAATVAGALVREVVKQQPTPGGTRNVEAYDTLLRGRALFDADAGEASDRQALADFNKAIALDPGYAAAYAARSRSLAAMAGQYAAASDLHRLYSEAVAAARKAVALAPTLARAHAALGYATFAGLLDCKAARAPYFRAAELGQGDADILVLFAYFASKTGQGQPAFEAIARAQGLDPLNPRVYRAEGSILNDAGRWQDSIAASQKALEMSPGLSTANASIGTAQFMLGKLDAARSSFEAELNTSLKLAGLAITDHALGNRRAAQDSLETLIADIGDSGAYQQAQIYAQFGQRDRAIERLDHAYAVTDAGVTNMLNDPMLRPLHSMAGYNELLARVGLA